MFRRPGHYEGSELTTATARAYLESMVAKDSDPTLSTAEITQLMSFAGSEALGWKLELAAAEGWRWKAGKVAALYSFAIEDSQSDQGQVYRNCLDQAIIYAERALSGDTVAPGGVGSGGALVVRIRGLISGNGSSAEEPSIP